MARMTPEQDFHGWLPIRVWQVDGQWCVDWCWFGDQRLTQPFFRDDVERALRLPFNYCELPEAAWGRLAAALALNEADIAPMQAAAQLYAKNPGMTFSADSEQKRRAASAELQADIAHWASEPYAELEKLRLESMSAR